MPVNTADLLLENRQLQIDNARLREGLSIAIDNLEYSGDPNADSVISDLNDLLATPQEVSE